MSQQTFKDWSPVSSIIQNTAYNYLSKVMTVKFIKTGYYDYLDVPPEVWEKSLQAESIGKFINTDIKPYYRTKQNPK